MENEISTEMKVELLKVASQLILSCADMRPVGGPRAAARQLGVLNKSDNVGLLDVLDSVYEHLVDKVGK